MTSESESFLSVSYDAAYLHHETIEETQQLYDKWAKTYDADIKKFGWKCPVACVNSLEKWLTKDKQARIMDVACGTGLVGQELIDRRFNQLTIDGVDMSEESIKISHEKKIYKRLICDKIGTNKLDIDEGIYDAVLCSGCFGPVHVTQNCFPELVRITKPGGLILIAMRQEYFEKGEGFEDGQFEGAIQALIKQNIWEELAREPFEGYFGKRTGVTLVFRVLQK